MVVLPESGCEMMARLRRRSISVRGAAKVVDDAFSVSSAVEEWSFVNLGALHDFGTKANAPRFALHMNMMQDRASNSVDAFALMDDMI